jgi:hypothetical protein
MAIEMQGDMYASSSISISCVNSYSRQFNDILKGQLQRAKQDMLATPTFCPGTTNADLTSAYINMVAEGTQVLSARFRCMAIPQFTRGSDSNSIATLLHRIAFQFST